MMPRPTTTSAAATTSTKNTTVWPPMSSSVLAKATKVRLTALSISSMHMNITSGLRRTSSPTAPMANSTAPSDEVPGGRDLRDRDHAVASCASTGLCPAGMPSEQPPPAPRPQRPTPRDRRRVRSLHLAGEHHGADDGDHEQHRGDLEGEHVVGEQRLAELVDVGHRPVDGVADRRPRRRAPVASPLVEQRRPAAAGPSSAERRR